MANKTEHTKKALLQALENTIGVVTPACKQVGISRTTYYTYYNEDPKFRKAVDGLKDYALDFAESQLFNQMKDGNASAIIFYLKTQGKERGYIERQEVEFKAGQKLSWFKQEDE